MKSKNKFAALYLTNFWGVMNDNLLKTLVCFIAVAWVDSDYKSLVVSATAGALVLPYLFFSPLAGKLPQYCGKVKIIRWAKVAEVPIMLMAIAGFALQSVWLAIGSVLLMGLQSALFSPSKYGLIKDIGGEENISRGMGGMEAVAFMGILLGTVAASFLAEMSGAAAHYAALLGLATLGLICSMFIHANEEKTPIDSSANVVKFIRDTNRLLKKYRGMNIVIHVLSIFWWLSASLQIVLILFCESNLGLTPSQTGYLLATTAIGITIGCLVGGHFDRRHHLIGFVPISGLAMAVLLLLAFALPLPPVAFGACIFVVAFLGGVFKIPLDAEIQKRVDITELNVVLAYFNQISFIYIFMASATNVLITLFLPTEYVFLMLAIVIGVASVFFMFNYRAALCHAGRTFLRLHYKVESVGRENLNTAEGQNLLVLPSHRAVIDPLMLYAEMYDIRLRPLVDDVYFKIPVVKHVLKLLDAVEVPDLRRSRRGVEKVQQLGGTIAESLAAGSNMLFYPSGHITTDGTESIGTRQLAYNTCRCLPDNTKVIAIKISGLWGSKWSRYHKDATPSLPLLLLKSLVVIFTGAVFFIKKRPVRIEYIDITHNIKEWATLNKIEFNKKLEELYDYGAEGEEPSFWHRARIHNAKTT